MTSWTAAITLEIDNLGTAHPAFEEILSAASPGPKPRIYFDGWSDECVDVFVDMPFRDAAPQLEADIVSALSCGGLRVRKATSIALRRADSLQERMPG